MKFVFNDYTDRLVGLSNEWRIIFRSDRFLIVTNVHNNLIADCGSLEAAMELGASIL